MFEYNLWNGFSFCVLYVSGLEELNKIFLEFGSKLGVIFKI